MNLIISSITIVDLTNKEAQRITFTPKKNLITSKQNHLGKSVIMKSLYYTLGAEVYFANPIKKINLFTYIDFELNGHQYRVCRFKWSFILFCDGEFVNKYSSVGAFEEYLTELFDLEIHLIGKDVDKTIIKCPPAFYYLPYYIDQENGWSANSFSFDRITQFDMPQRKNSYFFHLGVFDRQYVEISKRQKTNTSKKTCLEKDTLKLKTVIETLQNGLDDIQLSFDVKTLEYNISIRQKNIKETLEEMAKIRKVLIEAEDSNIYLEHEKSVLSKYIKNKKIKNEDVESSIVECPKCGTVFEQKIASKLEKMYLLESLHNDYANISEKQENIKKKIEKYNKLFLEKQRLLESYEETLAKDKSTYDAYIKSKATNQLLKEYREQIGKNILEIDRLKKDNLNIQKQLTLYTSEKNETNCQYLSVFDKLLINLDVPKEQVEEKSEPGSAIIASGAYGPRCKIAQVLAFVETKQRIAEDTLSFPIVIDSPNVLEQDKENLDSVMRLLMTWDKTENQIIVASIEGKETAASLPNVNIIELSNPRNHLLNSQVYTSLENEINELFMMF